MSALVDAVIVFTLVEALALVLLHRSTGRGLPPGEFILNMVSGLCLMLALAGLLRDAGAGWLALCLLGAGLTHGADLVWRARRRSSTVFSLRPQESAR